MGDIRVSKGQPPPRTVAERRRSLRLRFLFAILVVVSVAAVGFAVKVNRYILASGYVTTREFAEVRPSTTGTVAQVLVESGQQVEEGQVLVRLDGSILTAELEEKRTQVRKIEAEIGRAEAASEEKQRILQDEIAKAKLRLQNASNKVNRTEELLAKGLVAASILDDEKLALELARAELASLLARDNTVFEKELAVLQQELAARKEAVKRVEARLKAHEICAPIAGEVLCYEFVVGELVRPETVLFDIFGGNELVLKLRVAERHAARVAPGQVYTACLAPYRGLQTVEFTGTIQALRHVIQTEGDSTYRVAYCTFSNMGYTVPPGTTAEARIRYDESSLWLFLLGID